MVDDGRSCVDVQLSMLVVGGAVGSVVGGSRTAKPCVCGIKNSAINTEQQ